MPNRAKKDRRRVSQPSVLKGLKARRSKRPLAFDSARNEGNWRVSGCFTQLDGFLGRLTAALRAVLRTVLRVAGLRARLRDGARAGAFFTLRFTAFLSHWSSLFLGFYFYLSQFESLELKKSCASSIILLTRNCKLKANARAFNRVCCEKSSFLSCFEWPAASSADSGCAFRRDQCSAHDRRIAREMTRAFDAARHAALTTRLCRSRTAIMKPKRSSTASASSEK